MDEVGPKGRKRSRAPPLTARTALVGSREGNAAFVGKATKSLKTQGSRERGYRVSLYWERRERTERIFWNVLLGIIISLFVCGILVRWFDLLPQSSLPYVVLARLIVLGGWLLLGGRIIWRLVITQC